MSDDIGPQQTGDLQSVTGIIGGGGVSEQRKPGPPGRPPPPHTASPAKPKSAFDDLNDTIQMALGNSPGKQATGVGIGGIPMGGLAYQQTQQPLMQQPLPTAGANFGSVPAAQPPATFASPSKQPMGLL